MPTSLPPPPAAPEPPRKRLTATNPSGAGCIGDNESAGFLRGELFFLHNPFSSFLGTWTERDTDATGQVHFSGVWGQVDHAGLQVASLSSRTSTSAQVTLHVWQLNWPLWRIRNALYARAGFRRALVGKTPDHGHTTSCPGFVADRERIVYIFLQHGQVRYIALVSSQL